MKRISKNLEVADRCDDFGDIELVATACCDCPAIGLEGDTVYLTLTKKQVHRLIRHFSEAYGSLRGW